MVSYYSDPGEFFDPHLSDSEVDEKQKLHEEKLRALGKKELGD